MDINAIYYDFCTGFIRQYQKFFIEFDFLSRNIKINLAEQGFFDKLELNMKFLISISLSAILLLQGFNFGLPDLIKLGDLLEHANFHAESYGDSFTVFLSKHYGELKEQHNREHQEEEKEHEKLPFNNQANSHSFTVFVLTTAYFPALKFSAISSSSSFFFYEDSYSSPGESGIFQPPRLA